MKDEYALKKSMIFSICYVGLATIALYSMFPDSTLHGDWVYYGLFFTLPVSAISLGVRYAGMENEKVIVSIIQIIMFLLTWHITYRIMKEEK